MYIEPRTNIRILKNVPLDKTYDHTIYFSDASVQSSYFITLQKYNLTNYTYQRVKKGVARVGIVADNLYNCNYMMFQNTSFGNKWFYAFITSVEYINNECSEIQFEIDVMQTWFFDYEVSQCFIEREHSISDEIGEHIEAEPVATGEYVYNLYQSVDEMKDMCVIIALLDKDAPINGRLYDNIYGGCTLYPFKRTNVNGINGLIEQYQQKYDNIVSIYMIPEYTLPYGWVEGEPIPDSAGASNLSIKPTSVNSAMTLDTYKPKNNKLYTYPYNFLQFDNSMGETLSLRYEFFENLQPDLTVHSMFTQPCELSLRPNKYKNSSTKSCNTEQLSMRNFPICSWGVDSYQAYIAQQSIANIGKGVSGIAGATGGMLSGNIIGGASTGVSAIYDIVSSDYLLSLKSDISKGGVGSNNVCVSNGLNTFNYGRMSVNRNYAKIIDDFFTKFGYACKRLKKPNISSRPHFNYVKTISCGINGSIPADDAMKICSIYDNGITFWKNGSEVGNYSLDNSPT